MAEWMDKADKENAGKEQKPLAVIPRPSWDTASTPSYREQVITKRKKSAKKAPGQGDLLAPEIKGLF